ncbi:likely small subunit rRNA processing protein [Pseudozyma hubeiensis SY62]|uniref:Likely small subunit rRNA processing protein n=1 Tax=Pseudozyma hubeiensis (strain SY62) TaxID=1305764 RepID=R9NZB3_PSEHS|nr:likely small subunit rRNA processing protein [Pseudozyma hubeiensis SY62]GAC94096.1 likely small subunit rRNA processing protein [Pseudozyma hubeiensis SY62]
MAKKSRTDTAAASSSSSRAKDAKSTAISLSNGFVAVPLNIVKQDVTHWIYVRKHTAASGSASSSSKKVEALPADRTLFVANLPVDATEEGVRGMFGKVGGVSMVKFRRQSVVEEEDEREERGVGEESDEDVEGEEEEHHQISTSTGKKGKKKVTKTKVPQIIPLPPMDARLATGNALLSTASSAHIVFLDPTSLQRAFDLITTKPPKYTPSSSSPTGLSHLLSTYTLSRPPLPDIAAFSNSVISLYNYRRAHPLPRRIGVRGVTLGPSGELLDEDGFIIVQRTPGGGGKYGRAGAPADAGGSVGVAKHGFKENDKKKSTGLEDFYRFQMRERKREELAGLRRRFEEDKAKVERLKSGRRFKPY